MGLAISIEIFLSFQIATARSSDKWPLFSHLSKHCTHRANPIGVVSPKVAKACAAMGVLVEPFLPLTGWSSVFFNYFYNA
jgi:hypothetical protein